MRKKISELRRSQSDNMTVIIEEESTLPDTLDKQDIEEKQ